MKNSLFPFWKMMNWYHHSTVDFSGGKEKPNKKVNVIHLEGSGTGVKKERHPAFRPAQKSLNVKGKKKYK